MACSRLCNSLLDGRSEPWLGALRLSQPHMQLAKLAVSRRSFQTQLLNIWLVPEETKIEVLPGSV